jgi:hypothetical protein
MRVICIDDTKWGNNIPCPSFLEVVTISDIDNCPDGRPGYEFMEYGKNNWYSKEYFAPLSEPDASADEMQEAEKEAIINLETELV